MTGGGALVALFGGVLLIFAVASAASGRFQLRGGNSIDRDETPGLFWGFVVGTVLLGAMFVWMGVG